MANNEDYGDIEGAIDAIPPTDLGAWDMEAFLAPHYDTAAAIAAEAGLLEGAEVGQMAQQENRRDVVKQALTKLGREGKVAFLSNAQVNALYDQIRQGKTITAAHVDDLKVASQPTETSFEDYGLEEQLEDYEYDKAWGDIVDAIYGSAATTSNLATNLAAAQNQAAANNYIVGPGSQTEEEKQQAYMDAEYAYLDAIETLRRVNASREYYGGVSGSHIDWWHNAKRNATQKLLDTKAAFEELGGSTDPTILDQVLSGAVTAGGTASNVLSGAVGAPTFSQMVYNLPGLLDGTLSGTFQYGDTGPNLPIKVGEYGDTVIAATTGIPILDEIIGGAGTVAEEGLITPTGTNIPSIGEVIASAGEVVNETFDPTATFTGEDTKDIKDTTVGVSTKGTITGGDGTTVLTDGSGVTNEDETGGDGTTVLTDGSGVTNEDATDTITNQTTQTDLEKTAPTVDPEKTAPTFSGSIDTASKYGTVTTTDHIGPSLAASLGFTTEEAETLNNVLKGSLGFDTTQTDTLDNVLKGSLAGETTLTYDSSPHLSASLEGNVLKTTSNAPVLKGALGGANKIGGTGMPMLAPSVRGIKEAPGDLVDIDYLYDFAKGLDQPFLISDDEENVGKNLHMYTEGGTVADKDAVDMLTRRPGEYGRNYFTPGTFVPTGTAVGGAALDSNLIQIPQYTYQRELLPEFGGPPLTSTGTTVPGGTTTTVPGGTTTTVPGGTTTTVPGSTDWIDYIDWSNLGGWLEETFGGIGGTSTYTPPGETTTSETVDAGSTYTTGDGTTTTTSSVVANAINDYLQTLGYGLTDTDVTAANIQSALGEDFTLAQLADAFGTTEDVLNEILNPTSTTTTTTGAGSTYTPGESTSTTTTSVVSNALNDFLVERGFGIADKNVTQADIQAALDAGFTIDELVTAFDTTDTIINSILNPTSTTTTTTGGSSTWTPGTSTTTTEQQVVQNALNDFLVERGFGTTDKNVTKADIQAALDANFTLAQLAAAFTPDPTDANAVAANQARLQEILDWVDPNTTLAQDIGVAPGSEPIEGYIPAGFENMLGLAGGGLASLGTQGYYLGGPTDGMADQVPATIDGIQPAALSDGEFVVPADVVSHLGNGNSDAGAQQLHAMMDRVRDERTGTTKQGPEINPMQMMPA